NAPICEGVASPDIICSKAAEASSRDSAAPVAALAMIDLSSTTIEVIMARSSIDPRRRLAIGRAPRAASSGRFVPCGGNVQEILQQQMAVLGRDAFRMKLHPVNRKPPMRDTHHKVIVRLRRYIEFGWHGFTFDNQ